MVTMDMPADILVVEDNDSQRASIVASLLNLFDDLHIVEATGSEEAVKILLNNSTDSPPSMVLLDLRLGGGTAFDVLQQIREKEAADGSARTPVIIFSDSRSQEDVDECYRRGANSYIVKPLGHAEFQHAVEEIAYYWLVLNQAPD